MTAAEAKTMIERSSDNSNFYLISEMMPTNDPYLSVNSLPIIRKVNITNCVDSNKGCQGLDITVESRTGLTIQDVISNGVLHFTYRDDAENFLKVLKSAGNKFRNAFIIHLQLQASYEALINS